MALTRLPRPAAWRLGLLSLAGLALLTGLWAGLIRIGWPLPSLEPDLTSLHGPLLVGGFVGLVIGLERAVALGRAWAFGAPALAGLGSLTLLVGLPVWAGAALLVASSALLIAIFERIYRLRPEWSTILLILGVASWLVGNALWLAGQPIVAIVAWWVGFVVLTIVGERLELAQVLLPARTRALLLLGAGALLFGLVLSTVDLVHGIQLAGLGLLAMAAWLVRYDLARRSLGQTGLLRFSGVALLLGYVWLGLAGILWLLGPELTHGNWYDAMLHTVFLGFAFSMIFGHAPTIGQALTGIPVPFQRRFYAHLLLLHASLAVRVLGDVVVWPEARRWGGLGNVVAVLLFVLVTMAAARGAAASGPAHRQRLRQPEHVSLG
jgi:hypothetical protein